MVQNNEATSKRSLTIILNNQLYKQQPRETTKDERLEYAIRIATGELEKTIKRSGESLITTEMWGKTHVQSMS